MIHYTSCLAAVLFLTTLFGLPTRAFTADAITEASIHALIKRVDEAMIKRDIPALLACFTNAL